MAQGMPQRFQIIVNHTAFELELLVQQRLAREITFAIIHAAIGDSLEKRFCVGAVVHGGGAAAELLRVNRKRPRMALAHRADAAFD